MAAVVEGLLARPAVDRAPRFGRDETAAPAQRAMVPLGDPPARVSPPPPASVGATPIREVHPPGEVRTHGRDKPREIVAAGTPRELRPMGRDVAHSTTIARVAA
jgi:hypothetical protein